MIKFVINDGYLNNSDRDNIMKNYWVPIEMEFNIDTQVYEVMMRPFDKMKD